MNTTEILQGIKNWAAPKVIFDISAAHNNTKYEDLSAALGTNGGNIPQEYRKGGITVRYVQSSDNTYVRYNLRAQSFTTDTSKWAIDDAGLYIDNPEYIRTVLDSQDRILYAIKADGSFVFGAGVPKQIVDYVLAIKDLIEADVLAEQVRAMAAEKELGFYEDNPEYPRVLTDKDRRVIFSIDKEGYCKFKNKEIVALNEKTKSSNIKPSFYDVEHTLTPVLQNKDWRPLVYVTTGQGTSKFFASPVVYNDGRVIYMDANGKIKRRNLDGTDTLLLEFPITCPMRMIWMDSNQNVYVSPSISSEYAEYNGLWRLAYNTDSFTHVLSLYDPNSDIDSLKVRNTYSVWTMTEDREGHLYAGGYGNPLCPYLFVSNNGGSTWFLRKDMSTVVEGGIHIHFIAYNKYDNALYCTVGEKNYLLRSYDGGYSWEDMNVTLEKAKSCSICIVDDGIILGSDWAYHGMLYKVYPDGSYRTTTKFWANAIFAIRQSDLTGYLYAIGVIDAAVSSTAWYPPAEAIDDPTVLQTWIDSNPSRLAEWMEYYNSVISVWPDDAIRPQHSAILISKDKGETWEILLRMDGGTRGVFGIPKNGELSFNMASAAETYVISEGKKKYTAQGIDCEGDVLIKLNDINVVTQYNN